MIENCDKYACVNCPDANKCALGLALLGDKEAIKFLTSTGALKI